MPLEPHSQQKPDTKVRGLGLASEATHRGFTVPWLKADLASSHTPSHCQANAPAKASV